MHSMWAIRGVTRVGRLQNIREDIFTTEPITDVINTEDSGGLGMSVVWKDITSLGKQTNKTSQDSGREEDH